MLEDFKRNAAESELRVLRQRGLEKACASPDLEMFRRPSPEQVQASVKALLAIPREPVMNPCL
jgi:transposase